MRRNEKRKSRARRRQELMRRRRIAASVAVALLVLVVVLIVFAFKSCHGGSASQGASREQNTLAAGQSAGGGAGAASGADQAENASGTGDLVSGTQGNESGSGVQDGGSSQSLTDTATQADSGASVVTAEPGTTQAQSVSSGDASDGITERFTTSTGHEGYVKDGVTYIDGYLIANKTYSLPSSFIPTDPDVPVTSGSSRTSLDRTLMENWRRMQSDAAALGLNIYIASGYRSYGTQVTVYNNYVASDGRALADTYSSRAGHSEHQTGLCFDLNSIEDSFQYTDEGKWVNDNAYKYGFIIRFPKGKDDKTGYQYESWHLRYVGTDLSYKLYNNGDWISMEEYFGITSAYAE